MLLFLPRKFKGYRHWDGYNETIILDEPTVSAVVVAQCEVIDLFFGHTAGFQLHMPCMEG
jgi:hypothetical protein